MSKKSDGLAEIRVMESKGFWWFDDGINREVVGGLDKEKGRSIVKVEFLEG